MQNRFKTSYRCIILLKIITFFFNYVHFVLKKNRKFVLQVRNYEGIALYCRFFLGSLLYTTLNASLEKERKNLDNKSIATSFKEISDL